MLHKTYADADSTPVKGRDPRRRDAGRKGLSAEPSALQRGAGLTAKLAGTGRAVYWGKLDSNVSETTRRERSGRYGVRSGFKSSIGLGAGHFMLVTTSSPTEKPSKSRESIEDAAMPMACG